MESKQLILLGPPGVGVRAQAIEVSGRWGVSPISKEGLLQDAIIQASALGSEVQAYVDGGEPISDALMIKLLRKRFEQPDVMLKGWILAGYPQSVVQAQSFDEMLSNFGISAVSAVFLKATTGILINRLSARAGSSESITSIRSRLLRYEEAIAPVLEYYQQNARLVTINASRSVAEVTNEIAQLGEDNTGAVRFVQDEAALNALIAQAPVLVVDCIASWCGPCKVVTPLIDRLAEACGEQAVVVKLDFDHNRQVAKRFGLQGMPSVMFFKAGELIETLTGVKPYQVYSDAVTRLLES